MSIIDKLKLINERHVEYEKKLGEKADHMLTRYESLDKKTDRIFDRRHLALDERDQGLDDVDAELDRMSNHLGNEPSGDSSPISKPPAPKVTTV